MNLRRVLALGVGLSFLVSSVISLFASALTTVPTVFYDDAPLLISAYQRDAASLKFVQLYNAGDTPLKLADWGITNESGTQLAMTGHENKWLAPGTHVIASIPGAVSGASISVQKGFITGAKLSVIPPAGSGYKLTEYELKAAGVTTWRRSTTQTGYSSSTTSFTAYTATELFDDGLYAPPVQPAVEVNEIYPYASDCSPHDISVLCGDYIKLHNPNSQSISLDDYVLRTDSSSSNRTASNTFSLDGITIPAGGYHTVWLSDDGGRISLTNSGGYVWLEDALGLMAYMPTTTNYASAGSSEQGYAWAEKADGEWVWTSSPQPLSANVFPVVLTTEVNVLAECPAGKYRSPETNRCRTIEEAVNALATCPEGQYRNPDTNRCKSSAVLASASLVPCKEGQERNTETNRCRSIASAVAELIPCDEGYERNPATNRCKKSLAALTNTASVPAVESATSDNTALPWVLALAGLGVVGYGVYEWRSDIAGGFSKLLARIKK